jgi:hypothetical protein
MFWDLRSWTDQTHVSHQHVEYLRQLIELPTTKKWANRSEALILGGSDTVVCALFAMLHGSEFQDCEGTAMSSDARLQKENRTA